MSKEIWRPVVGYEGLYEVSNLGNVKSLNYNHTGKEEILSTKPSKDGYVRIGLWKNGKQKPYLVHRLVAQAFIPNPDNLPEVNHKIDDFEHRSDNRVENLEWCTKEYNNNYGTRNEKVSEKLKGSKNPTARKVKCVTTNEIFDTLTEAYEEYNVNQGNICKCCQGKRKYAGEHPITKEKLVWEYID